MWPLIDAFIQTTAVILLCWGLWETGNHKVRGPAFAAVAEVFIVIIGVTHETWSVAAIGFILFFIQIRTVWLWGTIYRKRW